MIYVELFNFLKFLFDAKCHFALMHNLFLLISEEVNRGFKGFSSTSLMSCVWRFHVSELCTVCERVVKIF